MPQKLNIISSHLFIKTICILQEEQEIGLNYTEPMMGISFIKQQVLKIGFGYQSFFKENYSFWAIREVHIQRI